AMANNSIGTVGVAPESQIMPIRTVNSNRAPALSVSSWATAIRYAVTEGAKVINMSLGLTLQTPIPTDVRASLADLDSAIKYAASRGVLIVAAAEQQEGFSPVDQDGIMSVPGTLPWDNIITVTASDKNDEIDGPIFEIDGTIYKLPSYGRTSVDIAAPGTAVVTTNRGSGTTSVNGTSIAAPHVSAAAALAYSMFPNLDIATLKNAILNAGDPIVSSDETPTVSNNRLNVRRTLDLLTGKWSAQGPQARFDDDYRADFAVWRPSTGVWHIATANGAVIERQWGLPGDVPTNGDFDGDGQSDLAVWRRSTGTWWISPSTQTTAPYSRQWGLAGDEPVSADYDGDGQSDIAVWRPQTGEWFIVKSSDSTTTTRQWGLRGDLPVPGDYDGDGISDIAVWRPSNGTWYVDYSREGRLDSHFSFGLPGDVPVPADYDGDGETDFAVWRPSTGMWWIHESRTGSERGFQWGLEDDVPQPADFNGDGIADFVVWRPTTGNWYVTDSRSGAAIFNPRQWGLPDDVPVTSALRRHESVFKFDGTASNDKIEFWYDPNSLSNVATVFRDEQFVEHIFLSWFVNRIEFHGGAGQDTMFNYLSIPVEAWGDEGNDVLSGGSGSDALHGGPGDDRLGGGEGSNELHGGGGNDIFSIPTSGHNFISDPSGADSLDFRGLPNRVSVDLRVNGLQYVADHVSVDLSDASAIEGIWGTAFDDVLIGNRANNALFGEQGNDTLVGGDGEDLLHGWIGDDSYVFGGRQIGTKRIWDVEGTNTLDFSNAELGISVDIAYTGRQQVTSAGLYFELLRSDSIDHVFGSEHADNIWGNDLNNNLFGRGGNDRLEGRNGDDLLWGFHGDDVYAFSGNPSGTKQVWDLEGTNDLDFQALSVPVRIDIGDDGIQRVTSSLAIGLLSEAAIDHVRGTPFSDTIIGNSLDNELDGGSGNDRLNGRNGNDRLWG
ncbi:MAG: S8 family serine peptidase, partial [Planctomycetales bacterium]|nr:S8 family serine peptidase [Planctomycetales bacterium]